MIIIFQQSDTSNVYCFLCSVNTCHHIELFSGYLLEVLDATAVEGLDLMIISKTIIIYYVTLQ